MDGVALVMACFMVGLSLVFFGVAAIGSYMLYLGYSYRETACSTAVALWAEVHGGTMLAAAIIGIVLVCITLVWSFTHQGSGGREGSGGDSSWKDIFWASGIMIPVVLLAIAVFAALVPLLLWGTVILFQDGACLPASVRSGAPGLWPLQLLAGRGTAIPSPSCACLALAPSQLTRPPLTHAPAPAPAPRAPS